MSGMKSEQTTLYAEINSRSHKIGKMMPFVSPNYGKRDPFNWSNEAWVDI